MTLSPWSFGKGWMFLVNLHFLWGLTIWISDLRGGHFNKPFKIQADERSEKEEEFPTKRTGTWRLTRSSPQLPLPLFHQLWLSLRDSNFPTSY